MKDNFYLDFIKMDSLNFEDFIPTYPEDMDENIQHLITQRNEFLEVAGTISEPAPKRGQYYRHQKALFRYMLYHDRMINIQETGTGKTCSLVAIAEYFRKYQAEKEIKHVYILEKGSTTVDEFKKQIACNCTAEDAGFINERVTDITLAEKFRKSNLTRSLGKWYTVKTYGNFVGEIEKRRMTNEQMELEFSGCIFFIDEAHNLSEDLTVATRSEETQEDASDETKQEKEKKNIYATLWRLFHNIKRSKIILGTATPMINEVSEIAPLMNLILPADQQMPIEKWNYENVTLEQMEPFFRGKVSYVRGLDTGARVIYEGENMDKEYDIMIPKENQYVPFMAMTRDSNGNIIMNPEQPKLEMEKHTFKSQSVVKKVVMSEFQQKGYNLAAKEDSKKIVASTPSASSEIKAKAKVKTEGQAFRFHERSASSFVFPDYSYGGNFNENTPYALEVRAGKYIKPEKGPDGKKKPDSYKLEPEFKKAIMSDLKDMSAKYSFIIENELKSENKGNAFCFSELVTGSGAILFGKILEEYGFSKYKENSSVFQSRSAKKVSYCTADTQGKSLKSGFEKGLRYGMISKDMSETQLSSLLELFNSPENRNGEYCKILIGTLIARDGINVFNVRRGYLLTPMWHPSGMHQALSRFIRSTSHQMLIEDEKEALRAKGKDETDATVVVKIYKMAAVKSYQDKDSVDLALYQITEKKDIHIRRMMRFMKQCAFDCPIHYNRNVRPGDKEGSAICDYMTCKYVCVRSGDKTEVSVKTKAEDIDFSTYDILYSGEVIEACKTEILKMMKNRSSIAIGCLYSILGDVYKKHFVNAAVDSIVADRKILNDRFGYPCFLNTNGILLYTQGDLPSTSQSLDLSDLSYYKDMLFGIIPNKFDTLINESAKLEQTEVIDKILSLEDPEQSDFDKFEELVDSLTDSKKIELLEKYIPLILDPKIEQHLSNIAYAFYKKFYNYIIITTEPLEDIRNVKDTLEKAKLKPGREREKTKKPIINIKFKGPPEKSFIYSDGSNVKLVIINTFTGYESSKKYNAFANFIKSDQGIRIYIEDEIWRDVTEYEFPAYKEIVKNHTNSILEQFKGFDEFGVKLPDGSFNIVKTTNIFADVDTRTKERGLACKSFHKLPLIEIIAKFGYKDPSIEKTSIPKELLKKETIINYMLQKDILKKDEDLTRIESYPIEKLQYIYRYSEAFTKGELCNIISLLFYNNNAMLIL